MGQSDSMFPRRRLLQLVGVTAGGSVLPTAQASLNTNQERSIVLEQDGECVPLTPLSGDEPVEELYDYTIPRDRFEGPPGSDGPTFSSHGTTDYQLDNTSILFLYDGPEGLSLVVVHGRLSGDEDVGGTVTFTLSGLPDEGEWIVRDDYYLNQEGEPAPSNFDRWDIEGEDHTVDWAYRGGRTDGGAFRGLGPEVELHIEPAFNDAAALAEDHDFGPIETWEVLSGDSDDPERRILRLDRPVTIWSGECPSAEDGDGVDARIAELSIADGPFEPGDVVTADVTVTNTGDREHTFPVGFSVYDPNGEEHFEAGRTDESLTLDVDETGSVTLEWPVGDDAPPGTYDATAVVWLERHEDGLQTRLDRRDVQAAFEVGDSAGGGVDARITDASVAGGTYEPGDVVSAEVSVENTGNREHTFPVGFSVYDPNGEEHFDAGRTDDSLTLGTGETGSVTLDWLVEDDAPEGTYDATVAVWRGRNEDGLETRLDRLDFGGAFEVG